jgi:large subunit ribosomal protein L30e
MIRQSWYEWKKKRLRLSGLRPQLPTFSLQTDAQVKGVKMEEEKVEKAGEKLAGETTIGDSEEPAVEEKSTRLKSKNKVIRKRKSRKEKENPLSSAIRLAVESGKVGFGSRKGVKDLLMGKARLIVVAGNVPPQLAEDVSRYGQLSQIPIVQFPGKSLELGSICGRPFPVSILAVYEEGVSNIMEFGKKK